VFEMPRLHFPISDIVYEGDRKEVIQDEAEMTRGEGLLLTPGSAPQRTIIMIC